MNDIVEKIKSLVIIITIFIFASFNQSAVVFSDTVNSDAVQQQEMDHSQHKQMLKIKGYERETQQYLVPDVTLINQDGVKVELQEIFSKESPVMLNFIYTTCTTICPVLSASFTRMQNAFISKSENIHLISISIDPENDTPAKLRDYAKRFQANSNWIFLTGSRDDITMVLKAFNAYRRDKMSHIPLTFLRSMPKEQWLRLEGFPSMNELVKEYEFITKSSSVQES